MQRLSQVSSHIGQRTVAVSASTSTSTSTPHLADLADTNTASMGKSKVVVTRQLIDEAQKILDEKKDELEIVQWNSEKVRHDRRERRHVD